MRSRLACSLADCGFAEAAAECGARSDSPMNVEAIVEAVLRNIQSATR